MVRAARMRSAASIVAAWQELIPRRRKVQPLDANPIEDQDARANMWVEWCNDWLTDNVWEEQRRYQRSGHTSIF